MQFVTVAMKASVAGYWVVFGSPGHVCDSDEGAGWESIVYDERDVGGVAWLYERSVRLPPSGEASNRRVNWGPRTGFRLV